MEELTQKELKKDITYSRKEKCHICDGKGLLPGKDFTKCSVCNGNGHTSNRKRQGNMIYEQITTCHTCRGNGNFIIEEDKCKSCNGEGSTAKQSVISINIPHGIFPGAIMRVPYRGDYGKNNGPSGDLLVEINVHKHNIFKFVNNEFCDLAIEYPLTFAQACLGDTIEIPTIYQNKINVDIKFGTQNEDHVIKQGYGLPKQSGGKGDLYIVFNIKIPIIIDDKQKELLQQLADMLKKEQVKEESFNNIKKYLERIG